MSDSAQRSAAQPLTPGSALGIYRIEARIGAGGMGEVYRAIDTRLSRPVAIKTLPAMYAQDAECLSRLQREARVLASLNHPNIAAIYGLEESNGQLALAIELVEGLTLADRLKHGALPLPEALAIAEQIAHALEYAHEKGVVHRDLKPANIKLSSDGAVKVLDFGLAKAEVREQDVTLTATRAGVIMGTPAYMAPEQATGKPVDKRADIWSFGVVLFEMVTARRPFAAGTVTEQLAATLAKEPDWNLAPRELRRLLRRCLEKDPRRRLRDIGDAWDLLEDASAAPPAATRGNRY